MDKSNKTPVKNPSTKTEERDSNQRSQHKQIHGRNSLSQRCALLDYIQLQEKAEIERKLFCSRHCILCGKYIENKTKGHIKYHIEEKSHVKGDYSLQLNQNGPDLQIRCKHCSKVFFQPSGDMLQRHSQSCTCKDTNLNNNSPRSVKREKKLIDRIQSLESQVTKLEGKLTRVSRTQEEEKIRLNTTEKQIEVIEQNVKTLEKNVDNHENVLLGLLNQLVKQGKLEKPEEAIMTSSNTFNQSKPVSQKAKERERDQERSIERARHGSPEKRNLKQDNRGVGERERYKERWNTRKGDYSRERSENMKQGRFFDNGGQINQYKRSQTSYTNRESEDPKFEESHSNCTDFRILYSEISYMNLSE